MPFAKGTPPLRWASGREIRIADWALFSRTDVACVRTGGRAERPSPAPGRSRLVAVKQSSKTAENLAFARRTAARPRCVGEDSVGQARERQALQPHPPRPPQRGQKEPLPPEEHRLQGLDAGANYYLTKSSFQDDSFITAVVDLIGEA